MKKRLLSIVTALSLLTGIMAMSLSAFAASKTPVWDYYSKNGRHKVSSLTFTVEENDFTYKIWYPKDIKDMKRCAVILYCNGTGSNYEKAPGTVEFLSRAASHGFICVTNTDQNCGTGASMDAGMTKILELNENPSHKLYQKFDFDRVGITGHSQGATCTMNLSDPAQYENSKYYKAIFAASLPTNALAASPLQNCPYDSTKVKIPTCLISGTGSTDQGFICPIETSLRPNFKNIKSDVIMARKTGVEHAQSNEESASYMIAWFDWQLNGDTFAAKAFSGKQPELMTNPDWQDFKAKVKAKKFTLKKLTALKGGFKASWNSLNTASGYQVRYALNKEMTKAKTTVKVKSPTAKAKSVTGLKKNKTYYVRVRSYRVIGNKTYYSKWSAVKAVKTK